MLIGGSKYTVTSIPRWYHGVDQACGAVQPRERFYSSTCPFPFWSYLLPHRIRTRALRPALESRAVVQSATRKVQKGSLPHFPPTKALLPLQPPGNTIWLWETQLKLKSLANLMASREQYVIEGFRKRISHPRKEVLLFSLTTLLRQRSWGPAWVLWKVRASQEHPVRKKGTWLWLPPPQVHGWTEIHSSLLS